MAVVFWSLVFCHHSWIIINLHLKDTSPEEGKSHRARKLTLGLLGSPWWRWGRSSWQALILHLVGQGHAKVTSTETELSTKAYLWHPCCLKDKNGGRGQLGYLVWDRVMVRKCQILRSHTHAPVPGLLPTLTQEHSVCLARHHGCPRQGLLCFCLS